MEKEKPKNTGKNKAKGDEKVGSAVPYRQDIKCGCRRT